MTAVHAPSVMVPMTAILTSVGLPGMATGPWTDEENDLIVTDYFAMLATDLAGGRYIKADHNRRLRTRLDRSRPLIEFKHRNIRAVLKGGRRDLAHRIPARIQCPDVACRCCRTLAASAPRVPNTCALRGQVAECRIVSWGRLIIGPHVSDRARFPWLGRSSTLTRRPARHQTACSWRRSLSDSIEAMTAVRRPHPDDIALSSHVGVSGRSSDGNDRDDTVFQPSSGYAQRFKCRANSERFSIGESSAAEQIRRHSARRRGRIQRKPTT